MPAPAGNLAKTGAFARPVERWRSIVRSELERGRYPWPPELILALITIESAGVAGAVNRTSGASGLMQVMPIAIREYNRHHKRNLTMVQMRGRTPEEARLQIRAGLFIMAQSWRAAYEALSRQPSIPISDLTRIADLWYAAGGKYARRALRRSPAFTWDAISKKNPGRAVEHARAMWVKSQRAMPIWDYAAVDKFLGQAYRPARSGFLAALVVLGIASRFFKKGKAK